MMLRYRLEKRRQAMLEMPQMIQTWKEVSRFHTSTSWIYCLSSVAARTRPWMEEMAQIMEP
jgi:hypothetical protein